jgi:hypothetical protein
MPPRTLLYGVDGVGKSTFAAGAPAPIFVSTEDGATRVQMPDNQFVPQFPLCTEWPDVFAALRTLAAEKHDYKTVVLDSADWAQDLAKAYVVKEECGGDVNKFDDYGKGYKGLHREWVKLLSALDWLHNKKGMEVIMIAHSCVREVKDPSAPAYDRWEPNLISTPSTSIANKAKEWCDIVLFANFDIIVAPGDDGKKGRGVLKKGESRVVYSAPAAGYVSKVRAGWTLPAKFSLDYAAFSAGLKGAKE